MNHLASLGQSQNRRLPSGWVVKYNLRSFKTAMECSCPECIDVSMALLAAGMLSVKTIISLHPVAVALVIANRIAKSHYRGLFTVT